MKKLVSFIHSKSVHLILLLFAEFLCLSFVVLAIGFPQDRSWGLSDIEDFLGVKIPSGSTDVRFYVGSGYSSYIELRLNAPPQQSIQFLNRICNATLYEGYNPFEAINSIQPQDNSYLIKMPSFTYYSYSPNAPNIIQGNRCISKYGGIHQISVDISNPDSYEIRFEQPEGYCNSSQLPCFPLGINFVNPIDNMPFMVVGLHLDDTVLTLVHDEICLDFQRNYIASWTEDWAYLIGADVRILLDDYMFPLGLISREGRLIYKDEILSEQNYPYWNYCLKQDWNSGVHNVEINLLTTYGEMLNYSFSFYVQEADMVDTEN